MRQANRVLPAPAVRPLTAAGCGADEAARPTTLLIADQQPLLRRGMRALFDGRPGFRVQGEAGDGDALLALARRRRPDVVLLDAALPGPDILDTVYLLVSDPPGRTAVVLLTGETGPGDGLLLGAVGAGVRGVLSKQGDAEDILRGVREVVRGGCAMNADVIRQLLSALRCPRKPAALQVRRDISSLTPRETQIFHLVAQGLTNQQISETLALSDATVKSHFHRICHKLSLRNRVDAVIMAYETGLAGTRNAPHPHPGRGLRPATAGNPEAVRRRQSAAAERPRREMAPA